MINNQHAYSCTEEHNIGCLVQLVACLAADVSLTRGCKFDSGLVPYFRGD